MTSAPGPSPFTDHKESVRAASTADITLNDLPAIIDGVSMSYGDRVLVKDQNNPVQNGIYVYLGEDETAEVTTGGRDGQLTSGALIIVEEGTTQGDTLWILTTDDPIEVGETALAFEQIGAEPAPPVDLLPLNNVWTGTNEFQDVVSFGATGFEIDNIPVTSFAGLFIDVGGNGFRLTGPNAGFTIAGSGEFTHVGDAGVAQVFQTKRSSSGPTEFYLYNTGMMEWGDGASAPDVQFFRNDVGVLATSGKIQSPVAPTVGNDLTNKDYVDSIAGGAQLGDNNVWTGTNTFQNDISLDSGVSVNSVTPNTIFLLTTKQPGNPEFKFTLAPDGLMNWGNGTDPRDVGLSYYGVGQGLYVSGKLSQSDAPTLPENLTTKQYVDTSRFVVGLGQSAPQSIPDSTPTEISWDAETVDDYDFHDGGTPTDLVVPAGKGGVYTLSAAISVDNPSPGDDITTRVLVNGSPMVTIHTFTDGSSLDHTICIPSVVLNLGDTDVVTIDLEHNEGANLDTVVQGTYITLQKI